MPAPDPGAQAENHQVEPGASHGPVQITVLGSVEIGNADPSRRPRQKSLELLVYLIANDGSATVDAILEDLLPEAPYKKARFRLHTYVSDLRAVLKLSGGDQIYLTHPPHRYVLNSDTITADLWRLRAATAAATRATDSATRITALHTAVDTYHGELAVDQDYLWAESYREAARRQALDAVLALADAYAEDPDRQITVLEPAITLHPLAEPLYQAALRAHHERRDHAAVARLGRAVTAALADADLTPSPETLALLTRPGAETRHAVTFPRPGGRPS